MSTETNITDLLAGLDPDQIEALKKALAPKPKKKVKKKKKKKRRSRKEKKEEIVETRQDGLATIDSEYTHQRHTGPRGRREPQENHGGGRRNPGGGQVSPTGQRITGNQTVRREFEIENDRENKFLTQRNKLAPVTQEEVEAAKFDKEASKTYTPSPRRPPGLVEVQCLSCKQWFDVNPGLVQVGDKGRLRWKCNDCQLMR